MHQVARCLSISLCLLTLGAAIATAEGPYKRLITVTNSSTDALFNVQVPVVLTNGNFDYAHATPAGQDVHFRTLAGDPLNHYRETWNAGGTSVLWVMVPSVAPFSVATLNMHYGTLVGATASDFGATFPNAYTLLAGAQILAGSQSYDWFEVGFGATLLVGNAGTSSSLTVTARRALVAGTINASGRGYQPNSTTPNSSGNGPGQGGPPSPFPPFSGAGGGGYGGSGGNGGGYSGGLTFGKGGNAQGSATGTDLSLSSSGGTGSSTVDCVGGAGAGYVNISAQRIDVTGSVLANGVAGGGNAMETAGGGGGAGGGVLLLAYDLNVTGTISATGGAGGAAIHGGGGGSGGRIKRFYENGTSGVPTLSVAGGAGGTGGSPAPQSGAAGSGHLGTTVDAGLDYKDVTASVGDEVVIVAVEPGSWLAQVGSPVPNPSRSHIALSIALARPARCDAQVLDLQGRQVRALAQAQTMGAGPQELRWDLQDERGRAVPPGLYLVKVALEGQTWTRRVVVVR